MQSATASLSLKTDSSQKCAVRMVRDDQGNQSWQASFPGSLPIGSGGGGWSYTVQYQQLWFFGDQMIPVMVFNNVPADFMGIFCVKSYSGDGNLVQDNSPAISWLISDPCI